MPKAKKKPGVFFGKRRISKEDASAEKMLKLYVKYIPQIRKVLRDQDKRDAEQDVMEIDQRGINKVKGRMYDFYEKAEQTQGQTFAEFGGSITVNATGQVATADARKEATPVSVMKELGTIPTPIDLKDLDKKIKVLKDKSLLVNQRFSKAQLEGLAKRLENRKKYKANFKYYNKFPYTSDEKIDALLAKYKLVMKESDLFVPTFPDEAVAIMKKYTAVTKKATGEKPVFYVIAEQKDFEKKREKLDPILLAQSPFGFNWQILGAWDKEIILLSEL